MQTSPRGRIGHERHPECAGSRICIREVDLLCPDALETQKTFIDEREAIHKKTFRKWLNAKLEKATSPIEVKDLIEDLRDGHVLLTLMETLLSTKLPREKGKMRLHKLTNLSTALKVLEQNGVKIVGISNYDIADGKARAILGLVWSIILRFQVQELFQETKSDVKVKDFHVEKRLLSWCQDVLDGYEDVIKLKDFTVGWRNGLAFNAIIHSHKPELFEFDDLEENDNKTNLQHAFDVADNEFSVPQLLDPSDIDVPQPDKKLIMMYLTSMYDGLKNYAPTRDRKNKKIQLKMEVDAYKASYSEIILYITQVETIVMSKIDNENKLENPLEEHKIAQDLTRDTTGHVSDVNDVTLKGQRLIEDGKISKMEQQEIKTQIETLEIRWEKLVMLVSRYSKRSQTALVSQKENEIQFYLVWIRESKYYISRKGASSNPEDTKKDLQEIENLISEIETKQPEVDRELSQAKELCDDETIDSDVKRHLEEETNKLERQWHQLKEEALGKQIQLQGSLESLPPGEAVTVAQDMDNVESAPPTAMDGAMDGASEEPMAYQVQVRRLNINVKSPAVSPRNEAQQKMKLQTWKRKHDETRGAINECEIIVKKMKREHDVQLFYDQYEECNQKMRKVDPMVVDTVDHGQNILKDEDMEEDHKTEVGKELENLVADYDDLLRAVDEKKSDMDEYVKDEDSRTRKQLLNWKVTRDELKPKISNCFILLRNLKAKDVPLERVELKLHAEKIEACHQEVTSLEPEVDEVIDSGNILLRSQQLDENERRLVTSDVNEIEDQYKTIKEDSTELKMWIDSAMKEEDSQAEEQLTDWRSKRDDLKSQISKHHIVLKGLKEYDSHLEPVQLTLRAKKIEVCYQEVTSLDPEVDRFVDQSNQLLKGGKLEEEEKNLVIRDMKDVDQQYEELRKESTEMKNEVEELLENQEEKKHDLLKWREWKHDVSSKLDDVQNTVDKIKSNSTSKNLQTVQDKLLLSEECTKQIKKLEPEVHSALDFGQQLRNESPLSAEERREIEEDMNEIQKRYDKLKDDSSDQHEWLVVYLQEQETAKRDELEKWRETKQNTIILIDSCRSKLDTENTDPDVSRDIDKQKAITKECQEDLPSIFEEVQSSLQNANSLLADDLLNKEDKDEVQADAEEIRNKLRSLQSDIQNQQTRLDEGLKQKQSEEKAAMRQEKLAKWTRIRNKLQSFLDDFEAKYKDVKSADEPKHVSEIEERINRTAGLSEEILAVVPDIQSGYGYGNELLNDHEMEEPDKDRVENEMEVMGDRFKELRNNVNEEHQRLSDLLVERQRARGGKYEMWKEQQEKLIVLLENAKRVVNVMKSNERPTTAEEIDEQLNESEDVFQQMAQFLPHVKEGLSFGNQLLDDDNLSDDQKDIIEEDVENLQIEFGVVRKEFEDHQEWLKSLRADVDEVTPMEQQVSESAVHFDFKDQDMPDARDTQVSSTTVQMKHEPGEHLFVIRQNVTADYYLNLLHDDMTPEEKLEVEKQEKLRHWRDLKQRIDELLKRLMDRLNRIKAADPISLKDLIEQQEDAKECKEEAEGSEPMIRESIRLGNDLINDNDVDDVEKERIRSYIATLEIKLRKIHHQANQEEERLEELFDKTHPRKLIREDNLVEEEPIGQQFQEREPDWDGLSKLDDKHVHLPPSPLRLNSVDQTVHLKFFEKGQDQYIMNLEDERTPEERRQAYNEHKLDRWRECEEKLDDFLKDLKDRLDKVSEKPRDRDDIKKKLKDAKECREDIEEQENEIVRCLDVANEILHDQNIDQKDKDDIKAYISELEIQLKVLHRQAVHDEDRLENMLKEIPRDQGSQDIADEEAIDAHYRERPGLDIEFPDEDDEKEDAVIDAMFERSEFPEDIFSTLHENMTPEERKIVEEEKKLEKWRIWQHKLDSLVDRLSRRLERVKAGGKPKDRKSLHEKKDEAQDCKEEVEESEPMIRDALDHADELLDDEHLDENEKEKIREYISEMRNKLKELHKDAYEEEERLHELLIESHPKKFEIKEDFVKEEPVEQQFHSREGIDFRFDDDHDIHENIHSQSYKRAKLDIKFEDDEDHGVESSHEEVKKNEPTHEIFTLLFDDLSPDERKKAEKEEKVGRWRDWKDKLDDLVNRLRNKLDRAKTSDLPRDRRGIQDQREDYKDCREEVEHSEPQIRKALDCANALLDDDDLDKSEKEQIRRYIASLEIDLKAIRKQAKEEEDRLDEILDQTPHPMKDVRVEHLVQEEPVNQQFSERPDWEMNLEDEHENEGDADKIVHQMFVAKEPTHYYVLRLHEDMTPEERREAEQEERLEDWRKWQDKLDGFVDRVKRKLNEITEQDTPQDRNAIRELRDEATECKEEIQDYRPRITRAIECANELLEDKELDDSKKEKIRQYVSDLEVELRDVYSRANEEEERLDDLLEGTPHPKPTRYSKPLAQEETIDSHHRERPGVDFNFDDETSEEHPGEFVHSMFVVRQPIHYYMQTMEDDLEDGERRDAKKEEKLDQWRNWKDKLDDMLRHLQRKLQRVQSTPKNRNDIREQRDEAKEIKEDIEESEPYVRKSLDNANKLLDDDDLNKEEKEKIRKYITDLEIQLKTLYSKADEEHDQLRDLLDRTPRSQQKQEERMVEEEPIDQQFSERPDWEMNLEDEHENEGDADKIVHQMFVAKEPTHYYVLRLHEDMTPEERREAEQEERLEDWRKWQDKLDGFVDRVKRKLNEITEQDTPQDRNAIRELRDEATECKEEIQDYRPRITRAIECANELLEDKELDDSEKEKIRQYVSDLEVELRDVYSRANEEEERLDDLLEGTPHPKPTRYSKPLAQEETIDSHHRERPGVDFNFDDETSEEHPGEFVHSMFVVRQPIHHYMWTLEDDLEDGERRHAKKEEKLDRWRNWKDKLDDMLRHLQRKLQRVQSTPKNRNDIREQRDEAKEIKEDIEESEPYVRKSLDNANKLLEDDDLNKEEKEKIRKYITDLEIQLKTLYSKADEEHDQLRDLFDRTPRSQQKQEEKMVDEELISEQFAGRDDWDLLFHEDDDKKERMPDKDTAAEGIKMQRWFEYRDKLHAVQDKGKRDLNEIKSEKTPSTREDVDEQLARTEDFRDRLAEVIPLIQESFEYGNKLLDDKDLTEQDKDIVENDMEDIGASLKDAKQDVDQHYQWLKELKEQESTTEDLISIESVEVVHSEPGQHDADSLRKQAEKEQKLSRWRSWREKLEELLDGLKNKLDRAKTRDTISSRKALKEQIHDAKACKEELDKSQAEIQEALVYAEELANDDDLSEKEKIEVRKRISEFNIQLKNLQKQADDDNNRLELELDQMDAEKSDKFSKWRKWREKVRALLDELQGKLYKVKNSGTPKNRKVVEENIATIKECEEGLQSSAPEMQFALDYGRQLADDDILSDNEQKTVKQETEKLEKELNELKGGVEEQKTRMFHTVEQFDLQRISKLEKWNGKKRTSRLLLDRIRNKVGILKFKLKPRNKNEIDERMDELQDCEEELEAVEVELASCINDGHTLLNENSLDKDSSDSVRDDVDELQENLTKLKDDVDDQKEMLNKLSEEEDEIKKEKTAKYRDWRKEIQDLIDKLKEKLKRLKTSEKKEPKDKEEKKECTDLAKECSRDLDKLQEEVNDLKDYGKGMINDGSLDDQERRLMEQDLQDIDNEMDDVTKNADIIQITLESMYEQQPSSENDHPIMEEWRERVRKVNLGLEVAEDRLDQPNELKNRNEIKEHLEDIKELNIGFAESEPQFLETVDLGKELLAKDDVPDENKIEIKEDLVLMAKRWGAFKTKGEDEEDRLHELLLSTSESDDLVDWHERCDDMQAWIDDTLSLLETRPVSLSASFGHMKRQQSVTEDVLQNLVQKQVEVNTIIDEGNHLLDDPSCGTDERKDIHDKMVKLHHDWNTLSVSLTGRQESIQDALVQLEQQHKDMETTWKKKYGPLRKWISQAQSRLNSKEFAIAPDLDSVKKQRKDIEKFQAEKSSHTPEVNEALQTAEYVLKGPQVDEEEKTVIQGEMQELQHGWEELEESLTWKQNRIEDTIRKLENQREDKLRKWQEGLQQVNTWITMTTENIKPEPKLASDVDSAYDQIDNLQDFVRDAPIYQDKVTNMNEFSSNLLADPCLGEDERLQVRKEMADCNKRWNEFVNLANARQSRLEHNLEKLEKDQDDDFNRWTIRSGRASELLDKFESKMPTVDEPLATQLEDVEKQEREFDVFANQVDLNETQMGETFSLGEGIINDSKYSKTRKDSVQGQLNLLKARWDRIKDFVDLRKGRLAETAKRLRESRRRKMENWEYRSGEFDIFLTNCERDIRSPDTISGDLTSVKKQMDDFKIAMSKVRSQKRKVFEYGQYTDEVIADPIMDNVSRDHIKIEKEARIDRWGHIEDMMNNHQAKLKEKLQELQKGQAEMDGWNARLVNVQTKMTNLEELNSEPVGKDTDVIEKQKRQMKKANLEKESLDPQVSDFLTFSEDLMDKPGINTEDRRHIDKQCDVLELRWHKAKGELERRDKSLEEKQEVLNKRKKSLLSEWQTRKTEVSVWITDMDQRIKSQDKVAPNVDKARKQYQELKDIRREITVYEKEVRKLEDLGETLIEDPGIHSNDKGLVTSEKQSIREHWESLNTKAHNVQRKLDDRVQDLESEQNRKLQEWRKTSAPLDDWINDAETKVESYDPIAYDIENVQQQNKENELMLKSLHKKQPKFDEVIDFGNEILKETYVGRDDRNKIQDEMEALQERWENVDDVVAKRHDDIQVRLQELEQEEGERKKKEEGERKRREEERRQREIEKQKAEEERKRREEERERQEEEKRRKEHEEKMRQEELERQLLEEKRKKREEEDERKRREEEEKRKEEERKRKEEEANKYIQMTYEPRISKPFEEEIMLQSEPELQSSPDQWEDPFAEAEAESRERLGVWRDDADSVRRWIKQKEPKLDDESDDEDLVGLKEQRKGLTKLENEVVDYRPTYDEVNKRYELLAEDQFLNDEDKQALNEDMEDVRTRWENMANVKEQKLKRLEGKIGQKEKRKLNDLIDCRADIKNLNEWITNKNNQFDRLSPLADDLPTLMIQREELKDFSKDIADHDPKFTECIQSANKLAKDPALSEDESNVIQKDAEKCEERWDELNEKVRLRVESVIEQLPPLQRKQKELLADCDDKLERFKKSIKKSNNNLDEQRAKWPLNEDKLVSSVDLTDEMIERVDQNETIEWRPTVDTSNERLAKIRVKLQRIQRDKKNRKWSFINAIKEVFGFGRKPKKTGVNIDNLIIQFEEQEDLMQEVSSLQRSANEVIVSGNTIATSRDVEEHNIMRVDGEMRTVNAQWNTLNFKVLERENRPGNMDDDEEDLTSSIEKAALTAQLMQYRLELLAKEIEDEYQEFDVWTENCETMNQFLKECERLQKDEEKIGTNVETLQAQIKDCQEFKKEVNEYTPQAEKVFEKSQNLIDSGRLDKADTDGVEKTRDVLQNRWKGIHEHLQTRQDNLDSALLDHLKKDSDSRLWEWRDDSLKLEHTLTDAHRKINSDVDETDFVAIKESAEELQSLESAVDDVFNDHMTKVSDSGQDLVGQKNLEPHEEGEVHNALDTLNKRLTDIEKSAQEKKTKIKDASSKYFHRSLSNMTFNSNQMEEKMDTEFSDVGADVGEVQKQLASLQALEDEMTDQDTKLEELKIQLQESKNKGLLHDDEEQQILDKISKLEITMDRVNTGHDENKKRLTQTLIVLHEELMEEIQDWLNDTEKQVDSIQVDQNDIASLREEHTNHSELKEEIASFEPTFNRAISLSRKLLNDHIVDSERAQSYENEMKSLNERMDVINLKTMDNGTKLSNGFAMYLTTRLDDAEVSLTHAETKLTQDDKGYVDLESAKKQLDISKTSVGEIMAVTKDVDDIVDEASALVEDGYFKQHEQEHFRARIDKIASRNKELGEQSNKEYKRQFDTYIILLRQHLGKMDIWLNKAEARRKATGEIQSGYDRIKKQLEEHQKFQDEIREHSMVSLILELDITDPAVNENVQTQVKILSERWASLWRWSEERRTQMLKLMNNWQKFRDEQLVLLNWLSSKEKVLKEMGATDLSNEEEVAQQLEVLKKMEKQLDEQGLRLQNLHKAGDELLEDVDEHDRASKDIKDQLNEFDECWNSIAKQVIDRIQVLETSQNKLREFRLEMVAVNEWMDETEQIISGFHIDMDPEEATRLQGKLDIKCDERSKYQTRVDRINRHGKDLQGTVDQPSFEVINDELEPFNKRWTKVSEQLENLSDKGYPTPENECCFVRILRRKLGICH